METVQIKQYLIVWGYKNNLTMKTRTAIAVKLYPNFYAVDAVMDRIFTALHKKAKKEGYSEDAKVIYEIHKL